MTHSSLNHLNIYIYAHYEHHILARYANLGYSRQHGKGDQRNRQAENGDRAADVAYCGQRHLVGLRKLWRNETYRQ